MGAGVNPPLLCASREICVLTILGTQTIFPFDRIPRAEGDKRGRRLLAATVTKIKWYHRQYRGVALLIAILLWR